MITVRLLLLILAFVCFLLTAIGVSAPRVNFLGAGLALWVLAVLVQ